MAKPYLPTARHVFTALMLALAIGAPGAGQPALAQGGVPPVTLKTVLEAGLPPNICLGEIGALKARVVRTLTYTLSHQNVRLYRPAIPVSAVAQDPGIAVVLQPIQITGYQPDVLGQVDFQIRGAKIGATTITLSAPASRLPGEVFVNTAHSSDAYVDISVAVNVVACSFEFKANADFVVPGLQVHGLIKKTVLKPDAQGQIQRHVSVRWSGAWQKAAGCQHAFNGVDGEADLTGEVSDSGQLTLFVSYTPTSAAWHTSCGGPITSDDPIKLNPSPLRLDIPVTSELVERTLPNAIETVSGQVVLVIAPQHDGAAP